MRSCPQVTLKGVAEAFGLRLSRDPETEQRLRAYFGEHLTAAHLKLAEMPEGDLLLEVMRCKHQ